MKCPKCQRENKPDSHYCIFCGSILPAPEAEQPLEPVSGPKDILPEQVQALQEEVRRLRELVTLMNDRLAAVESTQAKPTLEPTAAPPTAVTPTPEATPTPEPIPAAPTEAVPRLEAPPPVTQPPPPPPAKRAPRKPREWEQILGGSWLARIGVIRLEAPPPVTQPPPPPPAKRAPRKPREWEQILGGSWLVRIGVIALIIGVAFFLKYAFDQNWLGPTARVILGVFAGAAMVGAGYYWRKRYQTFAQALSGGGIALFYLSFFAAFAFFNLIPLYPAIGLLLLVSVGSAGLAIRLNSMALAIIGIVGAFSAPFILGAAAPEAAGTVRAGQGVQLLVYIMVVGLGVLLLSTFRNWRWFTLLALFGSLLAFAGWYTEYGNRASLLTSQLGITLIFLIFVGATSLFHIIWRKTPQGFDYALILINAAAYFSISYGLMWQELRVWMGSFTIGLALFYGGLAYATFRRGAKETRINFFAISIALILLTIAIPVQFGDRAWTTIAWAAQGTILVWLSFTLRMPQFRAYAYAVFAAMAVRLFFFDTRIALPEAQPILNERFLSFAASTAATYLSGYFLWRGRKALRGWEETAWSVYPVFLVAASLFLTVALGIELGNSVWTTIAWAAQGTILVWLSFTLRMPQFRAYAYAVFAAVAVRLLFFDTTVNLGTFQPVLNERFLAFIVSIAAMYFVSYLLWRNREERRIEYLAFMIAANIFTLWIIGAEVFSYREVPATLQTNLSLLVLLVLAGAITLNHLIWRRKPQTFDLVLTVLNAAAYFGISAMLWEELRVWMGSLYFALAFFYGVLAYVTLRRGAESTKLGFFATGIGLVFFTVAIPVQLGDMAWTTIAWAAEGTILMWLSFTIRMSQFRAYAYAVFAAMAVRLLFFDTTVDLDTFQPVLNERFLTFLGGIAALYLSGYLLWQGRKALWAGEKTAWSIYHVFLMAANFFTIWLLSAEVINYFSSQLAVLTGEDIARTSDLRSARNLSLTVLWAVYAVILLVVGIIRRSRPVRLAALSLLAVPTVKLFAYDVFALEQVYRIAAFVGLGVLLVVSGYLYQRYSEAIRSFLVKK